MTEIGSWKLEVGSWKEKCIIPKSKIVIQFALGIERYV
jgi:hypothetical protein